MLRSLIESFLDFADSVVRKVNESLAEVEKLYCYSMSRVSLTSKGILSLLYMCSSSRHLNIIRQLLGCLCSLQFEVTLPITLLDVELVLHRLDDEAKYPAVLIRHIGKIHLTRYRLVIGDCFLRIATSSDDFICLQVPDPDDVKYYLKYHNPEGLRKMLLFVLNLDTVYRLILHVLENFLF